jgi:hypothetical protein
MSLSKMTKHGNTKKSQSTSLFPLKLTRFKNSGNVCFTIILLDFSSGKGQDFLLCLNYMD